MLASSSALASVGASCRRVHRTRASGSDSGASPSSSSSSSLSSSSWTAREKTQRAKGRDYLVELGKNDTGNTNTNVGARQGMIDDVFTRNATGEFQLGADSDIANGDLRFRFQEARQFANLTGDYHVPEEFMEKVSQHVVKNFIFGGNLNHFKGLRNVHGDIVTPPNVPLILGVWGGKGCGKTFNLELACKAMGIMPIVTSAGELEDENAGEPGRLIRSRYKRAGEIVKRHGVMSCLIVNDIDAGLGWFQNTQHTVNNQTVCGTLMNLCDHPEMVSLGEDRADDGRNLLTARVPIIVTGNDLSTLYAPLLRDGRMDKWYWNPSRDEICKIVHAMFKDDGLWTIEATKKLDDAFPGQPLDFFGAARSKVYDDAIHRWMCSADPVQRCELLMRKMGLSQDVDIFGNKGEESSLWRYHTPPEVVQGATVRPENVFRAAQELAREQEYVVTQKLSLDYLKWQKNPEDLTDEERETMETRSSRERKMRKLQEDRRQRLTDMRKSVASDESRAARAVLLESIARQAREKREREMAEKASIVTTGVDDATSVASSSPLKIPGPPQTKRWITVSPDEAFDAFKAKECVVIDVRDSRSFRRESISGSINMPLINVEGRPLAYTYTTNAPAFMEEFLVKFPSKDAAVVFVGGNEIDAHGLDDPERCGCMDALIDRGYTNVVVVADGYDGWVRDYTPGGKKRLKEWKLDVVTGASGTSCVGAELPVVGSLAEERRNAQIARLQAIEANMSSLSAEWKGAFDRYGRLYFYNAEGESTWTDPATYDHVEKKWKLIAPTGPALDEISVENAVESVLAKSVVLIDVRNQSEFRMEAVNGAVNIPLRDNEGTKLAPIFVPVSKESFAESLKNKVSNADAHIVVVGGDEADELAEIAGRYVFEAGFTNVVIVKESVSQWLKQFTASGKRKKVLAAGAYKSDLLAKGAFNPFAGES